MSNHVHTLLFIDQKTAESWEPQEVVKRWHQLFNGSLLSHRFINGEPLSPAEYHAVNELITRWRAQLMDISWFMRCLNEPIARQANKDDGCTGRFWEGRYKSQAILDEKALAICLTYIELNPIRSGIAETPEQSEFTSISDRVAELKRSINLDDNDHTGQPAHLHPFVGNPRDEMPKGLPFRLTDYIELLDWTGRAILENKRGFISSEQPPMLERLRIDPKNWLTMTQKFENQFKGLVGAVNTLN
ncbi:MAG: transposase [Candidatus Thiodiazotropha sp.]|jgi:REP element-mobilizing transposase RayT